MPHVDWQLVARLPEYSILEGAAQSPSLDCPVQDPKSGVSRMCLSHVLKASRPETGRFRRPVQTRKWTPLFSPIFFPPLSFQGGKIYIYYTSSAPLFLTSFCHKTHLSPRAPPEGELGRGLENNNSSGQWPMAG